MIRLVTVASVLSQQKPPPSIDTGDTLAVDRWALRLGVSRDRLLASIAEVGSSIAAVRRHLRAD